MENIPRSKIFNGPMDVGIAGVAWELKLARGWTVFRQIGRL